LKAERLVVGFSVRKDFLSTELNLPPPIGIPEARKNASPFGKKLLMLLEILEILANDVSCVTGRRASGGVGHESIDDSNLSGLRFRSNSADEN
jgi:hypothetical protein